MISVKVGKTIEKWFSSRLKRSDAIRFIHYKQFVSSPKKLGFIVHHKYTKVINLNQDREEIIGKLSKNCHEKIRKARKKGVSFEVDHDIPSVFLKYNEYAKLKNIRESYPSIDDSDDVFIATKAVYENRDCAIHVYIMDHEIKRVRLYKSMSIFTSDQSSSERNFIGMANRFLHLEGIYYFKNMGFSVYDMGGYAYNTSDSKLQNINHFKDDFGGDLLCETDLVSLPALIKDKCYHLRN
jgi:lipid II:glycine glycyltransferase (peptidoglycan interpeptide bridge formation enzyme)